MADGEKGPCPCGTSSDAFVTYGPGDAFCFRCNKPFKGDAAQAEASPDELGGEDDGENWTRIKGDYMALHKRGITEETCKKIGYQVGRLSDGTKVHLMNIKGDRGELIAQKTRDKDKNFAWYGAKKNPPIYMSWLWPAKGRAVTLTEGELDAASYYQAWDHKWPVGSLPNGTGSVVKAITRDYEKLLRFDEIYLAFDADEPGQKAIEQACELLPAGRVKIITYPEGCKDANETLLKHGPAALVRAFYDAKVYRPDGIVMGEDFTMDRLTRATAAGYEFIGLPKLQEMTYGLRKGEITMLTAGSGIGKSTWARELAYDLHQKHGLTIGNVYLEENNTKTAQGYVALHCGVPLGRLRFDPTIISDAQWRDAFEQVIRQRMVFYDHFGSLDSKRLLSKLRYMAQVLKVDFIILDHISIVTSGVESSSEGERKDIDIFMTNLRSLVEETGVGVIAIVHLKRAQGKNFNEGTQVSLNDFRGSASLEQLSDNCFALERNQQHKDRKKQTQTVIRVLKCREVGETGVADTMNYDRSKGRNVLVGTFDAADDFDPHSKDGADTSF